MAATAHAFECWVKIEVTYNRHPKIKAAGRDARDLDLAAIFYCGEHLTDGFVPAGALDGLASDAGVPGRKIGELAERLLAVGRWEPADGGYAVHDYLKHNRSKAEVLELRDHRSGAGRTGGLRRAANAAAARGGQANAWPDASKTQASACAGSSKTPSKTQANVKQNPSKTQAELERELERDVVVRPQQKERAPAHATGRARALTEAAFASGDEAALVAAFKAELGYDDDGKDADVRRALVPVLSGAVALTPGEVADLAAYYDDTRSKKVPRTARALVGVIGEFRRSKTRGSRHRDYRWATGEHPELKQTYRRDDPDWEPPEPYRPGVEPAEAPPAPADDRPQRKLSELAAELRARPALDQAVPGGV